MKIKKYDTLADVEIEFPAPTHFADEKSHDLYREATRIHRETHPFKPSPHAPSVESFKRGPWDREAEQRRIDWITERNLDIDYAQERGTTSIWLKTKGEKYRESLKIKRDPK